MAYWAPAGSPFAEGPQPFEDALNLRRKTPSPQPEAGKEGRSSVYSAGMSTRELQALYRQSTAFPSQQAPPAQQQTFESRSTSFDGSSRSEDEVLKSPSSVFVGERPLDTIRRQSLSYDSLPLLRMPKKTVGPDTDPVFGLDIRDAFGWTFDDSTPYDVLLPTPVSPVSPRPHSLEPRRSSTPSLSSSPAASSATTSTLSSIQTPGATYGSDYGMARRRVSSMGDVPTLAAMPAPQPIPLGKSRMNNEVVYESPPEIKKSWSGFFTKGSAMKAPKSEAQKLKTKPPSSRRASEPPEKTRMVVSRSAMSLPRIGKPKSPPMEKTARMPAAPERTKSAPKEKTRTDTSRARPAFSVGAAFRKGKEPSQRSLPVQAPVAAAAAAPVSAAPAPVRSSSDQLPIAASMSRPSLHASASTTDVRLSKRQSEDLLYKKPSNSSLRAASTSPQVYLAKKASNDVLLRASSPDLSLRKKASNNSVRASSVDAPLHRKASLPSLRASLPEGAASPLPGLATSLQMIQMNKAMPPVPLTTSPRRSSSQKSRSTTRRSLSVGRDQR